MLSQFNFFDFLSALADCSEFFYGLEGPVEAVLSMKVGLGFSVLEVLKSLIVCNLFIYININSNIIIIYGQLIINSDIPDMNVVKQLLADVPEQQLKVYQSYLNTHVKLLMTSINKARVQDTTQVQIRKNRCIQQCYRSNLIDPELAKESSSSNQSSIYDTVQQIRECKQRCGQQKKAVKKYLDDINYYSSLKLSSCSKSCIGDEYSKQYNQCMWGCYNRLDRRYKKYWVEQRQKVQAKFQAPS